MTIQYYTPVKKSSMFQVYINSVAAAPILALLVAANYIQYLKAVVSFRLNQ